MSVWAHCSMQVEAGGRLYRAGSFHPQHEFWCFNSRHRSWQQGPLCWAIPPAPCFSWGGKKNPSTWKGKTGGLLGVQSQLGLHVETVFLKNTPSTRCDGKFCNTWEVETGGLGVWDQPLGMWNPISKEQNRWASERAHRVKATAVQAWRPEFDPWNPGKGGWREEPSLQRCSWTYASVPWQHVCVCTLIHTHRKNKSQDSLKDKLFRV